MVAGVAEPGKGRVRPPALAGTTTATALVSARTVVSSVQNARNELSRLLSQSEEECTEVYGSQNAEIEVY